MSAHHYDRTGERVDDEATEPAGPDLVRHVLEVARAAQARCPVCGGLLRPGVAVHPSCAKAAER